MKERELKNKKNGMIVLILVIAVYAASAALVALHPGMGSFTAAGVIWCFAWILLLGLKVLKPQEALVLTLFGKYYGTIKGDGFFFVNPSAVQSILQPRPNSVRAVMSRPAPQVSLLQATP